jgi:hypothetical protein
MNIPQRQGQGSRSPTASSWQQWSVRTFSGGVALFAGAEFLLAIAPGDRTLSAVSFALAGAGAVWLLVRPLDRRAAWITFVGLTAYLSAAMADLIGTRVSAVSLVRPGEVIALMFVALVLAARRRRYLRSWLVVGLILLLLLFAWIHILHRDLIAALIPGTFPARSNIPYLTGMLMISSALIMLHPANSFGGCRRCRGNVHKLDSAHSPQSHPTGSE